MFQPKYIKEGKMLLKGVEKFVHYKRDILSEDKIGSIEAAAQDFKSLLKNRDKAAIQEQAKSLQKLCEKSVPVQPYGAVRENVEVFFVAIVVALGIRAYFLQPFKIPTGSMQPTLNGYIGYPVENESEANPNFIKKGWDFIWKGRSYVNEVADQDFKVTAAYQYDFLRFFPITILKRTGMHGEAMSDLRIWSPLDQTLKSQEGLGLANALRNPRMAVESRPVPRADINPNAPITVSKGTVLARGYVETGDQVLVNKFSYHFRKPSRGEVFVFTTKGITEIERRNPAQPSQHYIKRLAAVPGDNWEVRAPEVYINGELAQHPVMRKIMNHEGRYAEKPGYTLMPEGTHKGTLQAKEYLALGDNSGYSFDSRGWGYVPEKNLVGPALFTYLPFGNHFGLIH